MYLSSAQISYIYIYIVYSDGQKCSTVCRNSDTGFNLLKPYVKYPDSIKRSYSCMLNIIRPTPSRITIENNNDNAKNAKLFCYLFVLFSF